MPAMNTKHISGGSHANMSLLLLNPAGIGVKLFLVTLFLLPLHSQLIYVMIPFYTGFPAEIISVWKEMVLFVVVAVTAANLFLCHERISINILDMMIMSFMGLL